jgi:hypothetical protein
VEREGYLATFWGTNTNTQSSSLSSKVIVKPHIKLKSRGAVKRQQLVGNSTRRCDSIPKKSRRKRERERESKSHSAIVPLR